MKPSKILLMGTLVLALCSSQLQAQCLCGGAANIGAFNVNNPTVKLSQVHEGDEIFCRVDVGTLPTGCPIPSAIAWMTWPDGTTVDFGTVPVPLSPTSGWSYDSRNFPNGTWIVDFDYINGDGEIEPVAEMDGTCDDGGAGSGRGTTPLTPVSVPNTEVTIQVSPNTGPIGFPATLTITETNIGEDPLTNVYVEVYADSGSGEVLLVTLDETTASGDGPVVGTLDDGNPPPGEMWTWTYPVVVSVPTTYIAYGFGTDPLGTVVSFANDFDLERAEDEAIPECPEPCLLITKEVDCGVSKVGDDVTYRICVTNCSETLDLTGLQVTDTLLGGPLGDFPDTLAPGQQACRNFIYTILDSDDPGEIPDNFGNTVENQATVQAIQICGEEITPIEVSSNVVTVNLVHPCLEVVVECISEEPVVPGGFADFRITLNNCGDVDLLVDVTDSFGICNSTDTLVVAGGSVPCEGTVLVPEGFTEAEICDVVEAHWTILDGGDCLPNEGTVVAEGCCPITGDTFCSFTQGYYGNPGGKKCGGLTTVQLLNALLGLGGPVVVGVDGRSIAFDTAQCIIDRLPAGGKPAPLPEGLGNANCGTLPPSLVKKNKPEIDNVLVGQVVTLSLNVRLGLLPCLSNDETDSPLGQFVIPEGPFCTMGLYDEDGCPIHVEVPAVFAGKTVDELLAIANQALGGVDTGYSINDINSAVTAFNEGFDECRTVVPCPLEICGNGIDDD